MDVSSQRRRLIITLAINGVAAMAAIAGIIGGLGYGIAWMNGLFFVALAAGFGAQAWLILGFMRQRRER
jgi:hypothetical protein